MSKAKQQRILMITQVFPSGLSGTTVKTRRTLEYLLDKGVKVDVCCIHHPTMQKNEFSHKNLQLFVYEKNVVSKFSVAYLMKAFHLLLTFLPFRIKKMYDARLDQKFQELMAKHEYDAVLFDGFSTLQYAREYSSKYIYIDDEDITDLLWKRFLKTPNPLLKLFFIAEWFKCGQYEKRSLRRVSEVWAISPNTKERLQGLTNAKTTLMPTIVQEQKNVYVSESTDIVFTALLSWMENVVGLKWFMENCWQKIVDAVPKTHLIVTGQMADESLRQYLLQYPNVVMKGFVPDLRTVYKKAAIGIAPILINSGIKVKVLTYLSFGVPVVSLTQATWGLTSLDGVKAASEAEFADAVIEVLKDRKLREKMSKQATQNIHKNHSDVAIEAFFKKVKFLS